jgi:N-terminal acetyltransferase B complex catalytic subunit
MTSLTVVSGARRLGLAMKLCEVLEQHCDALDVWFVDLFVQADNTAAQALYKMGYSVYRRVVGYYKDNGDAFDMRKPLSKDRERFHIREVGWEDVRVDPSEIW